MGDNKEILPDRSETDSQQEVQVGNDGELRDELNRRVKQHNNILAISMGVMLAVHTLLIDHRYIQYGFERVLDYMSDTVESARIEQTKFMRSYSKYELLRDRYLSMIRLFDRAPHLIMHSDLASMYLGVEAGEGVISLKEMNQLSLKMDYMQKELSSRYDKTTAKSHVQELGNIVMGKIGNYEKHSAQLSSILQGRGGNSEARAIFAAALLQNLFDYTSLRFHYTTVWDEDRNIPVKHIRLLVKADDSQWWQMEENDVRPLSSEELEQGAYVPVAAPLLNYADIPISNQIYYPTSEYRPKNLGPSFTDSYFEMPIKTSRIKVAERTSEQIDEQKLQPDQLEYEYAKRDFYRRFDPTSGVGKIMEMADAPFVNGKNVRFISSLILRSRDLNDGLYTRFNMIFGQKTMIYRIIILDDPNNARQNLDLLSRIFSNIEKGEKHQMITDILGEMQANNLYEATLNLLGLDPDISKEELNRVIQNLTIAQVEAIGNLRKKEISALDNSANNQIE